MIFLPQYGGHAPPPDLSRARHLDTNSIPTHPNLHSHSDRSTLAICADLCSTAASASLVAMHSLLWHVVLLWPVCGLCGTVCLWVGAAVLGVEFKVSSSPMIQPPGFRIPFPCVCAPFFHSCMCRLPHCLSESLAGAVSTNHTGSAHCSNVPLKIA